MRTGASYIIPWREFGKVELVDVRCDSTLVGDMLCVYMTPGAAAYARCKFVGGSKIKEIKDSNYFFECNSVNPVYVGPSRKKP